MEKNQSKNKCALPRKLPHKPPNKKPDASHGDSINRSELAKLTGISRVTISRILNGHIEPRISTARVLAKGLGMPLEEFIELVS